MKQIYLKSNIIFGLFLLATSVCYSSILQDSSLDNGIRYGKLPNGFTYYIKPLTGAATKTKMTLVVKVGNRSESAGEYAYAHLLEHLGFSAGKNISQEKSSLLFQQAGIKFSQIGGYTKNHITKFFVDILEKNSQAIPLTLSFYKDILYNLAITEKHIQKQRVILLNEAEGGNYDLETLPYLMEDKLVGRGAARPKDYRRHLESIDTKELSEFYNKWYRPELMALIAVGSIENVDSLEQSIKENFGEFKPLPTIPHKASDKSDYLESPLQFSVETYSGSSDNTAYGERRVRLYFRQQKRGNEQRDISVSDKINRELFIQLLNSRYTHKKQKYNSTFSARGSFVPEALRIDVNSNGSSFKNTMTEVYSSMLSIFRYGFSREEFSDEKENYIDWLTKRNRQSITYWEQELTNHFSNGEALPAEKIQLISRMIRELSLEDFNESIRNYIGKPPEDILIAAHKGDPILKFSEEKIRGWFLSNDSLQVKPYSPPVVTHFLMDSILISHLKTGPIRKMDSPVPGIKKYVLQNGLHILLKPLPEESLNKDKVSRINFHGFSSKGLEDFPQEDLFSAYNAPALIENSGIGTLDKFALHGYLDKMEFDGRVHPYIAYQESGIMGSASTEHLETALQLVYLYFALPRIDPDAFEDWKSDARAGFVVSPRDEFISNIRGILPDDNLPQGTRAAQGIAVTKLTKARTIYRRLFGNAKEFTFLFTGEYDEEVTLNLCRKYLGNLPVSINSYQNKDQEHLKDYHLPDFELKQFSSGELSGFSMVRLDYVYPLKTNILDWKEEIKTELLRQCMFNYLMQRMRYSAGGATYRAVAGRNMSRLYGYHEFFIEFSCLPEDKASMIANAKAVVRDLRVSPVSSDVFNTYQNSLLTSEEKPGDILRRMYDVVNFKKCWYDNSEKKIYIQSLTPEDIRQTAAKYLVENPIIFEMQSRKDLK
ncbi:M16 family metallopeptidase [Leeuwenhoekiella sp. A16]|uniref:M16 family metallopeptidase n=1 Tax=unclassified Leeuwenhoekiella TaxID=2615029 RepID=UPI003A80593A